MRSPTRVVRRVGIVPVSDPLSSAGESTFLREVSHFRHHGVERFSGSSEGEAWMSAFEDTARCYWEMRRPTVLRAQDQVQESRERKVAVAYNRVSCCYDAGACNSTFDIPPLGNQAGGTTLSGKFDSQWSAGRRRRAWVERRPSSLRCPSSRGWSAAGRSAERCAPLRPGCTSLRAWHRIRASRTPL